jgi:hypothetical protein
MSRKKVTGICHICGANGPLSFEHIPPEKAFNYRPVIGVQFEDAIKLGPGSEIRGPIQQKGVGAYTLCGKCNNNTGSWYGTYFVDWCYQGLELLLRAHKEISVFHFFYIYPLHIIKQIVTMFFSVNNPEYANANPELVRFVLNKDKKYLPDYYRFFVYLNKGSRIRTSGVIAGIPTQSGKTIKVFSEIAFPPYGYVMTFRSLPPDKRLCEITDFSRYNYNDLIPIPLKLPILPTHLYVPCDYRTKKEILGDYKKNIGINNK